MRVIEIFMDKNFFVHQDKRLSLGYEGEKGVMVKVICDTLLDLADNFYLDLDTDTVPLKAETVADSTVLTGTLENYCLGKPGCKSLQITHVTPIEITKSNIFYGYLEDSINPYESYPNVIELLKSEINKLGSLYATLDRDLESVKLWKSDTVVPTLEDHEERISVLEHV